MHRLIGVCITALLATWPVQSFADLDTSKFKTPTALTHDAPILWDAAKKYLPSKEQAQEITEKKVLPALKDAAAQIKAEIEKGNR